MGFTNYPQPKDANGWPLQGGLPYLTDIQAVRSINLTLNDPAGPATLSLSDLAGMIRLYPSADVYYNPTTAPSVVSGAGSPIAVAALGTGGIAKANGWTTLWLQPGVNRTIVLQASAGSPTCWVEVF